MFDAARGRTRGLIVRREADGSFRRLGLVQYVFARVESIGKKGQFALFGFLCSSGVFPGMFWKIACDVDPLAYVRHILESD